MLQDIERVLLTREEIAAHVARLADLLTADYAGKDPVLICVLKGAVHFFKDLAVQLPFRCEYEFVAASSYGGGTQTSGSVQLRKDVFTDLRGRHAVVIEDILDTGLTLDFLASHLKTKEPASLKLCTLLDKPSRRRVELRADYVGVSIPNEFVVGYGLDYREHYRNLPFIGVLKPEIYSHPQEADVPASFQV